MRHSGRCRGACEKRWRSSWALIESIVLKNSTTYRINVVAQGFDFRLSGDEVLLIDGDFPPPSYRGWRAGTLRSASYLGPHTRVFCTSWVFSFYGSALDLTGLAEVCRRRGVL